MKSRIHNCLLILMLVSCRGYRGPTKPPAQEAWESTLNLPLPATVHHLRGEGSDSFPAFLTRWHFEYEADPAFLAALRAHNRFAESHAMNQPMRDVGCSSGEFRKDFSWWTQTPVQLNAKTCLVGVYFPYRHYLVWDSATGGARHFVEGIRD